MSDGRFWFRILDDEELLMGLKPSELKVFLVVLRDIQRARNTGRISSRQVADRAGISLRHAHAAIQVLITKGLIECDSRIGATAVYRLPYKWRDKEPNRSPVGKQLPESKCSPTGKQLADQNSEVPNPEGEQLGEQFRSPVGKQQCSPVGKQHLESSSSSEKRITKPLSVSGLLDDDETPKPRSDMRGGSNPRVNGTPVVYATPAEELKALVLSRTCNPIAQELLDYVRSQMGGDVTQAFVDELKTHNGNFTNYPGFVRKLAGKRNRPASAPVTAAEATSAAYKCEHCFSRIPGRGVLLVDGKYVPCVCASPEYVQEQVARGAIDAGAAA